MAHECKKKRDRIAQSDMQHKEKQQRLMETTRTENNIIKRNNYHIIPSIITGNIANIVKSYVTITNEENQQARESRRKPTRHQRRLDKS
jgi:hypothetical protein